MGYMFSYTQHDEADLLNDFYVVVTLPNLARIEIGTQVVSLTRNNCHIRTRLATTQETLNLGYFGGYPVDRLRMGQFLRGSNHTNIHF